jgi:1-acyl-sn-glycerol-3-phosphate acyltransferase
MTMSWVRGGLAFLILAVNTVAVFALMLPPALMKRALPAGAMRDACDKLQSHLATCWVAVNNAWLSRAEPCPWQVCGLDGLTPHGWYFVSSNHQSWADILVLQRIFHRRIPFLKVFLKRELSWWSAIGLAWRVLDFPFLRRGGSGGLGGLACARTACQAFRHTPTAVMGFAEGARFTHARHASQCSIYRHLLMPKAGRLGAALAVLGTEFDTLLDVTIVYPEGVPRLWDLMCGRAGTICVYVRRRSVPRGMAGGDLLRDQAYRHRLRAWLGEQWAEKDRLIDARLAAHRAGLAPGAALVPGRSAGTSR